ncbi:YdcF family protein [Hankyongella ginsenosidimutans]|uniref:YdcF family protein n=1 Tax=Hankyongella ginsenosidimutans TaxID=1763828 RepID=A0A4D7CBR9_9SPHN|nr:YdcF family protein [Hankyongella ginsenosidimutans]QCI80086.1 YdcF family protein [Hankyongella ginsenosidimutans]
MRRRAAGGLVALACLLSAVLGGLGLFAALLPDGQTAQLRTDAIVVLTGGNGRVARAAELLKAHKAQLLLISGVHADVPAEDIRQQYDIPGPLFACCVTLGRTAEDTIGNANETLAWVRQNKVRSLRLVTSDVHMPRAMLEFRAAMPRVEIVSDPVRSTRRPLIVVSEYTKYLLRLAIVTVTPGRAP